MKIGADIEFAFSIGGRKKSAADLLKMQDRFGTDGCSDIAELRPFPSEDPEEVVSSMSRMLKMKVKRVPELLTLGWHGGSNPMGNPLGGHIHFGTGTLPTTSMLEYLDAIVAVMVASVDSRTQLCSRIGRGYGLLSAYREQRWGWEYRTLPSFLPDKKLTRGVMALSKVIVERLITPPLMNSEERNKFRADILLNASDKSWYARADLVHLRTDLETRIEFVEKYMREEIGPYPMIQYLFQRAIDGSKGRYCLQDVDMKKSWGLKMPVQRKISFEDIWRERFVVVGESMDIPGHVIGSGEDDDEEERQV